VHFNLINPKTNNRIKMITTDPETGPVERSSLVKGYEVEKGKYVLLTDDEIADVKLEAKKTVDLVQFVDADAIDPIYFERPYYVLPQDEDEDGVEAYAVLRDALKETKKIGLGQIVVRGQGSIVAIKPCGKGLVMETLRFADEVKKANSTFEGIPGKKPEKDLIELAEELIEKKAGEFHPEQFKDKYTVALRELIEAKQEHRKPREIEETPAASNVINLMDALKRSVKGGAAAKSKPATKRSAPRKAKKPRATKAKGGRKTRSAKKAA
jgi:DNA end-binding protein Ku